MKCLVEGCLKNQYKRTNECTFHRNLRMYGECKWPHLSKTASAGKDKLCQSCRKRGTPQTLYKNKICLKCNKRKTSSRGLCNYCVRGENYGNCKNGCSSPANDKSRECSNCKIRGGPTKIMGRRINSDTQKWCQRCESILPIESFYLQKIGKDKRAKYCKKCNKYSAEIRRRAITFGIKNVVQTSSMLCVKCWEPLGVWEVDHIKPKSIGGKNDINNLQIMCPPCNRKKGNREEIDYRVFLFEGAG